MKPRYHVAASLLVSGAVWFATKSAPMTASSFLAGIFIDIDHAIDFAYRLPRTMNLRQCYGTFGKDNYKRIFVLLHAWELLPLLAAACWFFDWNPWLLGVLIGMTQHMILDYFGNKASPPSYFLLWRVMNGFDFRRCFPKRFASHFFYGAGRH